MSIDRSKSQYSIFLDESGNSGSNYLDVDQPFYVLAGWIVPEEKILDYSAIKFCAEEMQVQGELHGKKIINKQKGQRAIKRLFEELGKIRCVPTFVIAEKNSALQLK